MKNNLFRKVIALFKKRKENNNFATINQPCYDKNGKFLGWFSRSVATALFTFCCDKNGILHVLASERGKGAADFQGCWNSSCGYLDFNETIKACAVRECLEETGIKVDENLLTFVGYEDDPVTTNHQNITFRFGAYIGDKTIDEVSNFSRRLNEKDEVGKIAWIPINEIDKYEWAFGHKTRIIEIARQMQLI